MPHDTRTRMIDATIAALQRHGVAGMSFTEILDASGAARGAIYHHFPGGKTQLVAEAAARNGQDIRAQLATLPAATPRAVARAFLDPGPAGHGAVGSRRWLRRRRPHHPGRGRCRQRRAPSGRRRRARLLDRPAHRAPHHRRPAAPSQASDLAVTLITLLEGAHVMCRAAGTIKPFDQAARATAQLFE